MKYFVTGHSAVANQYAAKICSSLSGALGIQNRGVKAKNLIVLNKTSMPAVLVECLFAERSSKNNKCSSGFRVDICSR